MNQSLLAFRFDCSRVAESERDEIESVLILDAPDLIRSESIESHDHYYFPLSNSLLQRFPMGWVTRAQNAFGRFRRLSNVQVNRC